MSDGEHVCAECGKECANTGELVMHKTTHATAEPCPICGKSFRRLDVHTRAAHATIPPPITTPAEPVTAGPYGDDERAPNVNGATEPGGTAPAGVRGAWERFSGRRRRPALPAGPTSPREKAPKVRAGKRATTAPILSLAWGGAGTAFIRSGADVPVGRVMQLQAEHAGDVLDALIARTWIDRVLQPLAQKADTLEAAGALFAMPILVATMERSADAAATLEPLLRQTILANLASMEAAHSRRASEAKKVAAAAANLGVPDGTDAADAIMAAIFAPPPDAGPPPAPEPNAGDGVTADN